MNQAIRVCECCGAVIPPNPSGPLTYSEQRVYDFIAKHPGCTMVQIHSHMYGHDPNGGPDSPNVISVFISRINKRLVGCRIITRRGPYASYRLVKDPS